ncbi:hypothetical protein [Mycolicibacterium sp. 050158]|uniref:hypothetical protein n=1 Tax=Mycolicibacterium sp. 050158 TaxID=3090602 RepID=UPI00299DD210|nr:hypothetical protein [Mycolicibacterium sp. 050158]MDX1890070.1 hypothetical protein [Mycolicibacterium sp. 050158]
MPDAEHHRGAVPEAGKSQGILGLTELNRRKDPTTGRHIDADQPPTGARDAEEVSIVARIVEQFEDGTGRHTELLG